MNLAHRRYPAPAEKTPEACAPRYFVPVCLYPHTRYRTREGVTQLIRRFALDRREHLVVVADVLLAFDNLVTGRFWNPEMVFPKASRQGEEILRLIRKTARRQRSDGTMSLNRWNDLAQTSDFRDFSERIVSLCEASEPFRAVVDRFVRARIERFVRGDTGDRQYDAEKHYIFGEISMSVYCTEILDYRIEVWERPLQPAASDPLGVLYARHPEIVREACGKAKLDRRLKFLYPDEAS